MIFLCNRYRFNFLIFLYLLLFWKIVASFFIFIWVFLLFFLYIFFFNCTILRNNSLIFFLIISLFNNCRISTLSLFYFILINLQIFIIDDFVVKLLNIIAQILFNFYLNRYCVKYHDRISTRYYFTNIVVYRNKFTIALARNRKYKWNRKSNKKYLFSIDTLFIQYYSFSLTSR